MGCLNAGGMISQQVRSQRSTTVSTAQHSWIMSSLNNTDQTLTGVLSFFCNFGKGLKMICIKFLTIEVHEYKNQIERANIKPRTKVEIDDFVVKFLFMIE